MTGYFCGTSREKLYSEHGPESLEDRRFSRRMFFFYKIFNGLAPQYLRDYLPAWNDALVNLRVYMASNIPFGNTYRMLS